MHLELGNLMTKAATVVRHNSNLQEAYQAVCEMKQRAERCVIADHGQWTNQNVVFTRALIDMFPLAEIILLGALQRDECRGAHFKPEFAPREIHADDPAERQQQAERWCDDFVANNQRWLKSTIATWKQDHAELTYEDVDTSLIPPRPRLYGLRGAEIIDQVWKQRQTQRHQQAAYDGLRETTEGM